MSRYRALYDKHGLLAEYSDGVLIFARGDAESNNISGPQVIRDINPYKSMVTGEVVSGRRAHRDHLKRHNCIEVGNDTSHMKPAPTQIDNSKRRAVLASLFADKSDRDISRMIKTEIDRRRS